MARSVSTASGGTMRASYPETGITAFPVTIACWANPNTASGFYETAFGLCNPGGSDYVMHLQSDQNDYWKYEIYPNGPLDIVDDTQVIGGRWYALVGRSYGGSSHEFDVHDPVAPRTFNDTSSASITFPTLDTIGIHNAAFTGWQYAFDGEVAECAIWDVGLTDEEVATFQAGVSPLLIRPQSLLFYVDLIRGARSDRIGNRAVTVSGTITDSPHPAGIIYPSKPELGVVKVGDRTLYAWTMHNAEAAGSNTAAAGFRNQHPVRLFDDTTQEYIHFYGVMPRRALRDRLGIKLTWTAGSTSGDVRWGCAFERHEDDATDLDSSSWGDHTYRSADAPASAGVSRQAYIRLGGRRDPAEIDYIEPGESFRLSVTRTPGSDSMSGDAELLRVELVEVL